MPELFELLKLNNSGWLLWVVIVVVVATAVARVLTEMSDTVAKVLGPVGRRWQAKRDARIDRAADLEELRRQLGVSERSLAEAQANFSDAKRDLSYLRDQRDGNAWTKDLQRQVEQLTKEMAYLRRRSEMNDAYLRQDADFHRWDQLGRLGEAPDYISYTEFERQWVLKNGRFDAP